MGQLIHDQSLCERAKRCIDNKSDCSSSQPDRKSVHLSNENQGPPVDRSANPTVPRQFSLDGAAPNMFPSAGYFPLQGAPNPGAPTYPNLSNYTLVPIPDSARQAVPNRRRTHTFVPVPVISDEDVASPNALDVSSPTASEQAISNSPQAVTVDRINQADADQALVNEFATVLAIASQIPVHQAAAMQRPVRFTVNQSMAPSSRSLSLQMLTIAEAGKLATVDRLTDTANQATAGFFVRLYSGLFKAGGIQRDTVRRWIQSGNARLPANLDVSRLAVALVENPSWAQIFAQSSTTIRAVDALERDFQLRIQQQRQSISLSQQEQPNDSSLRHSQEGPEAVEEVRDEDQDSDAAILFPDNPYLRGFSREEMYAQTLRNRYASNQGSRRGMDGASSEEHRRMEMRNRGRRNAIQLGSDALSPGSNTTATYSGPLDVDGS
ncbi:hypothetical protein BPOR_0005g00370 [Botrytis porri]|uniref:Uncharacterized protein n=1 Tax=Botrytis porri TaxID=87229 RepID=A0A4Z1L6K2_9HELO|nr:hypothetical protein BPOR_0005g00370 [Botrytis porri]